MHDELLFDVYCPALGSQWAEEFTVKNRNWDFSRNVRNENDIVLYPGSTQAAKSHDQFVIDTLNSYEQIILEIKQACSQATMRVALFREPEHSFDITIALEPTTLSRLAQFGLPIQFCVYPNSVRSDETGVPHNE